MSNYTFTFIDNEDVEADNNGIIRTGRTYAYRTSEITIIDNSIVFNNDDYVHMIGFYSNGTWLGYKYNNDYDPSFGDGQLGSFETWSDSEIPANATSFIVWNDTRGTNPGESNFLQLQISYQTPPNIYLGGPQTVNYSYDLITDQYFAFQNGSIAGDSRFIRTNLIQIQNNNIILDNLQNEFQILFFDEQENIIEFYTSQESYNGDPTFWENQTYYAGIIDHSSNFNLTSNYYYFAVNFVDGFAGSKYAPIITYTQASNNEYYYDALPAIDNIYYGAPSAQTGLQFDGVNDRVLLPNTTVFNFNNQDFRVDVTFNANDVNSSQQIFTKSEDFNNPGGCNGWGFRIIIENGGLRVGYVTETPSCAGNDTNSVPINANQTYEVSARWTDGVKMEIFLDGVLVETHNNTNSNLRDFGFSHIGTFRDNNGNFINNFNGDIYYLSVYNNGIKNAEYLFDEGTGTILNDNVGTNDGTIVGATWQSGTSYPTIDRVYAGEELVYGQAPINFGGLVTEGLVFAVDAANTSSYSGGSTWTDIAGNIDGTINNFGSGVTFNPNVGGGVMQFDGSTGSVSFPDNTDLNVQNFTIQVWTRPNSNELNSNDQQGFWFEKGYVNTQYSLFIENNDNGVWKTRYSGLGSQIDLEDPISRLSSSNWQMLTSTKDGTAGKMFYNTSQVQSSTLSGTFTFDNNGMFIGSWHQSFSGSGGTSGYHFNGDISVVLVYNRALTPTEITQNFNAVKSRYGL